MIALKYKGKLNEMKSQTFRKIGDVVEGEPILPVKVSYLGYIKKLNR